MEKVYGIDFSQYPHIPPIHWVRLGLYLFVNPSINPARAKSILNSEEELQNIDLERFQFKVGMASYDEGEAPEEVPSNDTSNIIEKLYEDLELDPFYTEIQRFASQILLAEVEKRVNVLVGISQIIRERFISALLSGVRTHVMLFKMLVQWGEEFDLPKNNELADALVFFSITPKDFFSTSYDVLGNLQAIDLPLKSQSVMQLIRAYGAAFTEKGMDTYLECYHRLRTMENSVPSTPS